MTTKWNVETELQIHQTEANPALILLSQTWPEASKLTSGRNLRYAAEVYKVGLNPRSLAALPIIHFMAPSISVTCSNKHTCLGTTKKTHKKTWKRTLSWNLSVLQFFSVYQLQKRILSICIWAFKGKTIFFRQNKFKQLDKMII